MSEEKTYKCKACGKEHPIDEMPKGSMYLAKGSYINKKTREEYVAPDSFVIVDDEGTHGDITGLYESREDFESKIRQVIRKAEAKE